jgi:opacity protein-like surface antigen
MGERPKGIYDLGMRLVTIAVSALVLAAPATAAGAPVLRVKTMPFTVSGSGFKAGEVVQIVVQAESRYTASTRTRSDGTFSVRVQSVKLPRCTPYLVRATGNQGSRAALKYRAPECSPQ